MVLYMNIFIISLPLDRDRSFPFLYVLKIAKKSLIDKSSSFFLSHIERELLGPTVCTFYKFSKFSIRMHLSIPYVRCISKHSLSTMKDILSKIFSHYLEKLYHSFILYICLIFLILGFMKSVAKIIFLKYQCSFPFCTSFLHDLLLSARGIQYFGKLRTVISE